MKKLDKLSCILFFVCFFVAFNVRAELSVKISESKIVAQKTIVKLELKNKFAQRISSVRAVLFLIGEDEKIVGQMPKWIIGGTKEKIPLLPEATANYNFVITKGKPFNKTKLSVIRVIFEDGKMADVSKDVQIETVKY